MCRYTWSRKQIIFVGTKGTCNNRSIILTRNNWDDMLYEQASNLLHDCRSVLGTGIEERLSCVRVYCTIATPLQR